jgi:DNA-binding transcriptional MerR regulator
MADAHGTDSERPYTIGELAREFAITARAIRFYEAKGLIAPARKGVARTYSRRDRARLTLILRGKNLGFSLEEIKEYLRLYDADPSQVTQLRHLLVMIDERLRELRRKKADLERTQRELKTMRAQAVAALKRKSPGAN